MKIAKNICNEIRKLCKMAYKPFNSKNKYEYIFRRVMI